MGLLFESFIWNLLAFLLIAATALYYYFTSTFNYWKNKRIHFLKPEPFFGNFRNLIFLRKPSSKQFLRFYQELEGYDFGGVFQARTPALIIRSPDLIKHVLVKDFAYFHDRGMTFNEKANPLSGHLFNLEGSRWKNLRAKLTPTFTSGKMKNMFHVLRECGDDLKNYLDEPAKKGESVEMKEVCAKFTTDIIGTCAFGLQFNSMKDSDSEFRNMGRRIFKPTFKGNVIRILLMFFPWMGKVFNLSFMPTDLQNFFLDAVKDTVKYREDNNVVRHDFMDLLIQLKHKGSVADDQEVSNDVKEENHVEVNDEVIAAQAFIFFLAGFETSSTTMSFCLHELALNPDIQEKLREEIRSTIGRHGGQITYEGIQQMEYLDQVINETMRKYPPVANLIRRCTKTYTIPGTDVQVDKGTRVFIPAYAVHWDPKYYPEPEKFLPERFSVEEERKRPHYTYLPFGEGPRVCIGLRFGMLQTKVGLAVILSNYRVTVCEQTSIPLVLDPKSFITSAKGGMWFKLEVCN